MPAPYIFLSRRGKPSQRYDLPISITGDNKGLSIRLHHVVQSGGNGIVFDGAIENHSSGKRKKCAVKFLRQEDDARYDRFTNEVRIMKLLDHPKVAKYFDDGHVDVGANDMVPWVAMELGDDNLRVHVTKNGPVAKDFLLKYGAQICEALEHLHAKGIVHRDTKPDNFVLFGQELRMIDFGIAKLFDEDVSARPMDKFTVSNEFVGPVFYSSPELIAYKDDKDQVVDHRSDLFQLGKVLWYLATGEILAGVPSKRRCPFQGKFYDVVMELLQQDPGDRIQTAGIVRERLLAIR